MKDVNYKIDVRQGNEKNDIEVYILMSRELYEGNSLTTNDFYSEFQNMNISEEQLNTIAKTAMIAVMSDDRFKDVENVNVHIPSDNQTFEINVP